MSDRVSVIIPVYRGETFIGDAVRSALAQTVKPDVIVVDDASGDRTAEMARNAGDGHPRLTVITQSENRGPAAARNRAIAAARTDWVALLDADDRMAPDRLESLRARATAHGWDMAADDLIRLSDWERPETGRRHWRDEDFGIIELDLARFVRENIYHHCGHGRELGYLKPLMRRGFLSAHGLRYDETMKLGEDFDLYARALAAGGRFGLTDPAGYFAFDRPDSLSRQHTAADLAAVWRSSRAIAALPGVDAAARAALREHRLLSHKKWAWVRLIDAVHERNPLKAAATFAAPPAVIAELIGRVRAHFSGGPASVS